jgi:four helix bundle protein
MFSFEKLEVYKKAYQTNLIVYRILKNNKNIEPYARNQFGRASLSIVLNIAEGCAKFSNKDRKNFFTIARGSIFECSALLCLLYDEGEIDLLSKEKLYDSFEEISKILYVMIRNLET